MADEGRRARVFDWDYKRPAPWAEITAYAAELSEVYIVPYDGRQDDPYGLIIADHRTDLKEDRQIIDAWRNDLLG